MKEKAANELKAKNVFRHKKKECEWMEEEY